MQSIGQLLDEGAVSVPIIGCYTSVINIDTVETIFLAKPQDVGDVCILKLGRAQKIRK